MEAYWDFTSCGYQQDGFFFSVPFPYSCIAEEGKERQGKKKIHL
jgi:hypothetical protein